MPVKGRLPLLKLTVSRLIRQGVKVVCCGHTEQERDLCLNLGAAFIQVKNDATLGYKWQLCLDHARTKNPDAIMIMGSSDMVQDGWVDTMYKTMNKVDAAMIGTEGIYYLHIEPRNKCKAIWWSGYQNERIGEPVGTGRLISKKALDYLNWKLFDIEKNVGMDWCITQSINSLEGQFKYLNYNHQGMKCLSISTYKWNNLHNFFDEAKEINSKKVNIKEILSLFPEMENIFNENNKSPMPNTKQGIVPYTMNVGGYDQPRKDILCFTDYNRFKSNHRNSRIYLAMPHKFINCEISILVSCEVTVKIPYEQLVKDWLGDADMALFKHPWRDCVHEEIIAAEHRVKQTNDKEELDLLRAQGKHYRKIFFPEHAGHLPETAIIIRRHNALTNAFNEAWWAEMCKWSYRDQCSYPLVYHEFIKVHPEFKVNYIEPDVRVHPYTTIGSHLK